MGSKNQYLFRVQFLKFYTTSNYNSGIIIDLLTSSRCRKYSFVLLFYVLCNPFCVFILYQSYPMGANTRSVKITNPSPLGHKASELYLFYLTFIKILQLCFSEILYCDWNYSSECCFELCNSSLFFKTPRIRLFEH